MTWSETLPKHGGKEPRPRAHANAVQTSAAPYAAAALKKECSAVRAEPEGNRNNRLNVAAYSLGQLVGAGALDEVEVARELTRAALDAGLGEHETEKTIAGGLAAGKAEPRDIPPPKQPANDAQPSADDAPEPTDDDAPDAPPRGGDETPRTPAAPTMRGATIGDVISHWRADGPLVHEPTGISRLDELTGGGPVYGSRWYVAGAPDAGKTALLVQIAHVYALRGVAVGLLAVDEEAGDLVTRLAQRAGWSRHHCEARDPGVLDSMRDALGDLPIRIYGAEWTIDAAATDLAAYARQRAAEAPSAHPHGPRAMLGIDSVQTVTCAAELAADRPMAEVQAVTARTRAIRAAATAHRLIAIATSELGRSAYASGDPDRQTSTLAAAKWSGAIEYSARVLLGLRSVAGESDLIDVELAKNKHGPRDERVYLRIDRRCQVLTETSYEPPPEPTAQDRDNAARIRVVQDAAVVARTILAHPGIGVRELRSTLRAETGMGIERIEAAMALLGASVVRGTGPRRTTPLTLDLDRVPDRVRHVMEATR
jgi:KaiC/GvpD/RAD55 family RecA-like ATPase